MESDPKMCKNKKSYIKQHITKRQWDELSDKEKDNFIYIKKENDCCYYEMNIGTMIEFLGPEWYEEIFSCSCSGGECWVETKEYEEYSENGLCDALWEAVKNKLRDESRK